MKDKLDSFWFGLTLGVALPPAAMYGLYLWINRTNTFFEFVNKLKVWGEEVRLDMFIWCLIPIGIAFAVFYFTHMDKAARGVIFPAMIYIILLLISTL